MSFSSAAKNRLLLGLSPAQKDLCHRISFRVQLIWCWLFERDDLPRLMKLFGSDKWGQHWYAAHYQSHFSRFRHDRFNLLEIGVGGYSDPKSGGSSLRAWRMFFTRAKIFGVDVYDKSYHNGRRIQTFQASQACPETLLDIAKRISPIKVIIDDGSHRNDHTITTFLQLFPLLTDDGMYVIEDTQTSYWSAFGGDSKNLSSNETTMGLMKRLVDGLNYDERDINYEPTYFDQHITAVHFYHNIVFIQKGLNSEASNVPFANRREA